MKVLVTDRFDVEAYALLKTGPKFEVSKSASHVPTEAELSKTEALVIRSRTKITASLLAKAPLLKLIVTSTSGFDHIDLNATTAAGVKVLYTPTANAASASELTWALVLAAARKVVHAHKAVKSGNWSREALLGVQLSGKTYGIIGLGRIGTRVARVAQAFGLRTVAFDPYREDSYFNEHGCERMSLDELFKFSDVVSCHVPATPETSDMIPPLYVEEGNPGLIFVNTSRGQVIKESLLTQALDEGWFGAVGLDVFEKEPLPRESKLLGRENVVLSPHIGATTQTAFQQASFEAAEKVLNFAADGTVQDALPGNDPWLSGSFKTSLQVSKAAKA